MVAFVPLAIRLGIVFAMVAASSTSKFAIAASVMDETNRLIEEKKKERKEKAITLREKRTMALADAREELAVLGAVMMDLEERMKPLYDLPTTEPTPEAKKIIDKQNVLVECIAATFQKQNDVQEKLWRNPLFHNCRENYDQEDLNRIVADPLDTDKEKERQEKFLDWCDHEDVCPSLTSKDKDGMEEILQRLRMRRNGVRLTPHKV